MKELRPETGLHLFAEQKKEGGTKKKEKNEKEENIKESRNVTS